MFNFITVDPIYRIIGSLSVQRGLRVQTTKEIKSKSRGKRNGHTGGKRIALSQTASTEYLRLPSSLLSQRRSLLRSGS